MNSEKFSVYRITFGVKRIKSNNRLILELIFRLGIPIVRQIARQNPRSKEKTGRKIIQLGVFETKLDTDCI